MAAARAHDVVKMTYEYICNDCGHAWVATQHITAQALTECPECGQPTAKRLVSGGSYVVTLDRAWAVPLLVSRGRP
jgi:putative FmdB family regulatory protein